MILMEKDGQKKFVFDCFIPRYRADGWRAEGEADDVQTSPEAPPEQAADETAAADGNTEKAKTEPEQAADETAAADGNTEKAKTEPEQAADETAEQTFICPHCGKEYSKEASLKTHIRRNHAEE